MSRQLTPGEIDDANLAYHYEAEETAYGDASTAFFAEPDTI
jgi:hypothetical protein